MNFSIDVAAMQRAVKILAVGVKANSDDSSNSILLDANDYVTLMSHNGAVSVLFDATQYSEVKDSGTVVIMYNKIKSFINSFKPWDGSVGAKHFNFSMCKNGVTITVDNFYGPDKFTKGSLTVSNSKDSSFHRPPDFGAPSFSLNSTIFKNAMSKVLYAINTNTDISQPALQGMNVQFTEDSMFFAASDGIVLSEYQVKNMSNYVGDDVTLHYDFIAGLRRLINDNVQLLWEIKDNRVSVKFEEVTIHGRRIIGHKFPDYKPVFNNFKYHTNLSKEFLMGSINPITDILDKDDNFRVTVEIKDKKFKIYTNNASIDADIEIEGGIDFSVDLNGRYLFSTIDAIKDDYILFKFSDDKGLVIFDSSTFNDQKALISPIRKR